MKIDCLELILLPKNCDGTIHSNSDVNYKDIDPNVDKGFINLSIEFGNLFIICYMSAIF